MTAETLKYTSRSQRVYEHVKNTSPGTKFSIDELSEAAGTNVGRCRTVIHTASDYLWKTYGRGLESVRGEGYEVVDSERAAELMRKRLRKGSRQFAKGGIIGRGACEERMDPETRRDFRNVKEGFEVLQHEVKQVQRRVDRLEDGQRRHDEEIEKLKQSRRKDTMSDSDLDRVAEMVARKLQEK